MSNYTKLLQKDALKLMNTYAIHPADDVGGYKGDLVRVLKGVTTIQDRSVDMKHSKVKSARKIAYVKLIKKAQGSVAVTGNEGSDVLHFDTSYAAGSDRIPIYFLPWDAGGAMVQLTLPQKGQPDPDPDLFFTAAINGCSVFFQGTPQRPTIYHCGGDTGKGSDHAAAAKFWRDMVAANRDGGKGDVASEVNKTHYIKEQGSNTTQRAAEFEAWLKNKNQNRLNIMSVNPWGCVMGIRKDDKWTFYLQENGSIVYTTMLKKHFYSKPSLETRIVGRPMIVRQVYPGMSGGITMKSSLPKYTR